MDEHRHVKPRHPERLRNCALVAEIRQGDDHTGELVGVGTEERRAGLGLVATLDGSVHRVLRTESYRVDPFLGQRLEHVIASRAREVTGEEAPIADDDAECHTLVRVGARRA